MQVVVGSGFGVILLCFFLRETWVAAQGDAWTMGGQFMAQLTGLGTTIVFAGVATLIICVIVEKLFGGFRIDEAAEKAGLDHDQHGEHGYGLLNLN